MKTMKEQLHQILERLIAKNNIRIHRGELKLQLYSHPSYPSLHALTGVLDHFNINNLALRLPVNAETLQHLPTSWIAQIQREEGESLVLVERKKTGFKILDLEQESSVLSETDFLATWSGIALIIEKDEQTIEAKHDLRSTISFGSLLLLAGFLFVFVLIKAPYFFPSTHFLLSLVGLGLSIFIVRHELGFSSAPTNRLCNLSSKTSCDAILHSNGATLFNFKLSDISLFSFVAYLSTWLLLAITTHQSYAILYTLTLVALPFTVYSIYYQAFVVKKWCPLCLGIVVILLLQALALVGVSDLHFSFDLKTTLYYVGSLILGGGLWISLRPLIEDRLAYHSLQVKNHQFKRNFSIFNTLLHQESLLQKLIDISGEIILGNPQAAFEIILITNPLCHYCKSAHQAIEQVLRQSGDQIKLIIRFSADPADQDNIAYQTIYQLLTIYNTQGDQACRKALQEVYQEDANLELWLQRQATVSTYDPHPILVQQHEWCLDNGINFTPALYLNRRAYPKEYLKEELIYFIDELIDVNKILLRDQNSTAYTTP